MPVFRCLVRPVGLAAVERGESAGEYLPAIIQKVTEGTLVVKYGNEAGSLAKATAILKLSERDVRVAGRIC